MKKRLFLLAANVLISFGLVLASTTQIWRQDSAAEFAKGTPTDISIHSDGYLQLAPELTKLFETTDAFLWAGAEDSQGRLFVGSGNDGKVYVFDQGKTNLFFDAPEVEVHALAVDGQDNLYVGTSPDGKIYRVTPSGSSQVFFEPGVKYIWALAFDADERLYVGTGGEGKIFRVDQQGHGDVFFDSEEKHIRCLAVDGRGNLIAGSANRARVFRFTPGGRPFILYDAPVKEITSVVVAQDGSIYAAGVGGKETTTPTRSGTSVTTSIPSITVSVPAGAMAVTQATPKPLATAGAETKAEPLGSTLYSIGPDGYPREVWTSKEVTIFSLALRADGSLLAGTGGKGGVYRIDPDGVHSAILTRAEPSQVTVLLPSRHQSAAYAITSNLARVYALQSSYVREGTFVSQVKDTNTFSKWGRIRWRQQVPPGATVKLYTRSGNTREPDNTWADWSRPMTQSGGETVTSPPGRFIQWKLVLSTTSPDQSPRIDSVELAYLPRNVAPKIESLTLQPPDIAFQKPQAFGTVQQIVTTSGSTGNGGRASTQAQSNRVRRRQQAALKSPPRKLIRSGYRTVTWQAKDINDDDIVYSVYIRAEGETTWKLLRDDVEDTFYSWDTRLLPDGNYTVRLVASDRRSNPPAAALTSERLTEWFEIDNTPPRIKGLSAVVVSSDRVRVRFEAHDSATPISEVDYLVDNVDPRMVLSTDGILDSEGETFDFLVDGLNPGEHTITVRVKDGAGNLASARAVIMVE